MPYELFIGLRYTATRRRNGFLSFISWISIAGLTLGVGALIVVLSVMNGFQDELRTRILGVAAHVQITGFDGELADWQSVALAVATNPEVRASAPYVAAQGMLTHGGEVRGVAVRGVLPELERHVADFDQHMRAGRLAALAPGEFGIVLGAELARALRVRIGERVALIAPQGLVTPAALLPRLKQFRVVGVFDFGMFEYDSGLALIHLRDAQVLYQMPDRVSGLRLRLADLMQAPRVAQALVGHLPAELLLTDWTRSHANLFRAVAIEKNMMFILLTLIVAVAAFNIVSALIMVVTDKRADIAILRTLGASPRSVMTIFVVQGAVIGTVGLVAGLGLGLLLAANLDYAVPLIERLTGVTLWSKEVYPLAQLPVRVVWTDVAIVLAIALLLTLIATLYPSLRAARVDPAEALRHE
ncbi:MAG: hypothetical protein AMXMBFR6_12670 [Betaproteobacteria bacterium]|nr:lipoprotein-releasing ABC transporter permease subunit [Rhodocyclaceae bacterium]MCG3188062.1 Lipoprotein-releasing system transmembrane protein LolE [Rhodocyclaceae bacterium]